MNINKCVLLFSVVLCILLFYKFTRKETFQGGPSTTVGTDQNVVIRYRDRPTSFVNQSDYDEIKNRFINDLSSTTPVSPDGKSLSELINDSLKNDGLDMSDKITNLQNSIDNIQALNQVSTGFLDNIDHLGNFQDNYSKKLKSILESKYQGTLNNSFNLKDKIAEQKIKSIEDILSTLDNSVETNNNNQPSTLLQLKSIRCLDNNLSLNIEQVVNNNIKTDDYMIYINDNILFYELVTINNNTDTCSTRQPNVCDYRCTDGSGNNILFDTEYKDELSNAYFRLNIINNYNEYNSKINAHNQNNLKRYTHETDDITYPFYLVQPKNKPGLCLNFEAGNMGEFNVRVKPCSNTKTERFEALIYQTFNGCNTTV